MTAQPGYKLPFENGDVMDREEFHRLYSQCPGLEHVELIEGVVYMPSPTKHEGHGREQLLVLLWLGDYMRAHKGEVEAAPPISVLLDDRNEPEPDAVLFRLAPGCLQDGYVAGAPELVVEIANTSQSRDLGPKKQAYQRTGVQDYIVWRTSDHAIDWFQLHDGVYVRSEPDAHGIIESLTFPGLRLDVPAALAMDVDRVLAALR